MDTITITPYKEGMDKESVKRDLDIHADGYRQGVQQTTKIACEWLKANITKYLGCFVEHYEDDREVVRVVPTINADLYKDFSKAMRESV